MKKIVALSLLTLICGCFNSKNVITTDISSEPVSLDFSLAEDGISLKILGQTMRGLVSYDRNMKIVPALAEKVTEVEDGYDICLKEKIRWSDGKEITTDDFIYGFTKTLSPATQSKTAKFLFDIKNAKEYKEARVKSFSSVGVAKIDDKCLHFSVPSLTKKSFLHVLTMAIAYPQRKDLEDFSGNENYPSTGPFKFSKINKKEIILVKNNRYYDRKNVSFEKIIFKIISDEKIAEAEFDSNRLDIFSRVSISSLEKYKKIDVLKTSPYFATYYLAFNFDKKPFNDIRLRKAVIFAIDKEKIINSLKLNDFVANNFAPEALFKNEKIKTNFENEVLFAKEFFKNNKTKISIGYDISSKNDQILEIVKKDLASKLNLQVELQRQDWKTHIRMIENRSFNIYRFGWLSPFYDPITHYDVFRSSSLNNYTGYNSSKYDYYVDHRVFQQAEELLLNSDAVVIPIFHYVQNFAVSKRIENFYLSGLGVMDFENMKTSR